MVNAATNMEYNEVFYKEETKLPEDVVKDLELADPSRLSNHIEVNGRWIKIDDKRISGMVKERRTEIDRLRKYFNITDDPRKVKTTEDKSHMLKVHKDKIEPLKAGKSLEEELRKKAEKFGFAKFRKFANKRYKVTGRSVEGIINDILSGKKEL